jgi:hypothetical protein
MVLARRLELTAGTGATWIGRITLPGTSASLTVSGLIPDSIGESDEDLDRMLEGIVSA